VKNSIISSFLLFPLLGHAGESEIIDCKKTFNSQQIFECSKIERAKADQKLNEAYRGLLTRIAKQYKPSPELGATYTQKIKESQRLWIKLKDADCALEAFKIEAGTQAYETTVNKCVSQLSLARPQYLEKISP